MKRTSFSYEVSANVELTGDEIKRLCELSESHYDGVCQFASKIGGFLYGIKNQFRWAQDENPTGTVEVKLSFRQLDILAKIAEGENRFAMVGGVPIAGELGKQLHEVLAAINAEGRRVSGE